MRFADSAFKHGIDEESIRHVAQEYGFAGTISLVSNSSSTGLLPFGDAPRGMPLEITGVMVRADDGEPELLVIHAMRLRRRYQDEYERVMFERWG